MNRIQLSQPTMSCEVLTTYLVLFSLRTRCEYEPALVSDTQFANSMQMNKPGLALASSLDLYSMHIGYHFGKSDWAPLGFGPVSMSPIQFKALAVSNQSDCVYTIPELIKKINWKGGHVHMQSRLLPHFWIILKRFQSSILETNHCFIKGTGDFII